MNFTKYFIPYIHGGLTVMFWWMAFALPPMLNKDGSAQGVSWAIFPAVMFSIAGVIMLLIALVNAFSSNAWGRD